MASLLARIEALELALYGRLTGLPANQLLGSGTSGGVAAPIPQSNFVNITAVQTIAGNKSFSGFTSLGGDVALKVKKVSGTTASTEGGLNPIVHGLNTAKIIGVVGIIRYAADGFVGTNHLYSTGYQFDLSCDANYLFFINVPGNSANILSKPAEALILYTE